MFKLVAAGYVACLAVTCLSFLAPDKVVAAGGPIQISTCQQLQGMDHDLTADYELTKDINCYGSGDWNGGAGFSPIGVAEGNTAFTGTLDGNGHTILGLTINRGTTSAAGLFYLIQGTSVTSINFSGASITGHDVTGTLAAGVVDSYVTDVRAEQSEVTSTVAGETGGLAGFLVGNSGNFHMTGSWFSGTVSGVNDSGGLVGYVSFVNIINSYSTGTVSGTYNVGGLVGEFQDFWGIANTYSHSNVTASGDNSGGLVGQLGDGMHGAPFIYSSYASGSVTSSADSAGGLVGLDIAAIGDSFAAGAVSAPSATHVGGFVGTYNSGGSSDNIYDQLRTGQPSCAGGGSCGSVMSGVTAVNTNSSPNSTYFFNNFSHAPLSAWDTAVWVKKASNFPVLHRLAHNVSTVSTTPATTSIKVRWSPPGNSDTPDITGYTLKYRLGDLSDGWTTVSNIPASAHPSYTIKGLKSSTAYSIAIFAKDQFGTSSGVGIIAYTKAKPADVVTTTTTSSSSSSENSGSVSSSSADSSDNKGNDILKSFEPPSLSKPINKHHGKTSKYGWLWAGVSGTVVLIISGFYFRIR